MYAHTLVSPVIHRRRGIFLAAVTQQVRTSGIIPELVRAGAALAGIVAWGVVLALMVG